MSSMAGITAIGNDQIAELLAKSRQRGQYDEALKNFIKSSEVGIMVSLTEGPFQGKKPASVKTGFVGATRRPKSDTDATLANGPEAKHVRVIQDDDKVFLVRADLAGVDLPENEDVTEEEVAVAEAEAEPVQA